MRFFTKSFIDFFFQKRQIFFLFFVKYFVNLSLN